VTLTSKRELIQAVRRDYRKSSKAQKSAHLDHLVLITGLKRNYLNRLLLKGYTPRRRKPGRKSRYAHDPQFMEALKRILPPVSGLHVSLGYGWCGESGSVAGRFGGDLKRSARIH
jgi:hypothetical protein